MLLLFEVYIILSITVPQGWCFNEYFIEKLFTVFNIIKMLLYILFFRVNYTEGYNNMLM